MPTKDEEQRIACLTALAIAFNREVSAEFFMAYLDMGLTDVPTPALKAAVGKAVQTSKFMPSVSELRSLAGHAIIAIEDREPIAWQALCGALRNHGYYGSVTFDDPAINATIRNLGGWMAVSERAENEVEFDTWFRKDFSRVYLSKCRTGVSAEEAAPLIGFHDHGNGMNGYGQKPPAKILTGLPSPAVRRIEEKNAEVLKLTASIGNG